MTQSPVSGERQSCTGIPLCVALVVLASGGCDPSTPETVSLEVPRGYMSTLERDWEGRRIAWGPFVGYYFRPQEPPRSNLLHFICFNERQFYTRDLPANARLFEGTAVFAALPEDGSLPGSEADRRRIVPVFFEDAPDAWVAARPEPQDEYVHFHSAHDAEGAVRAGYWLRHVGAADFRYDMGGRVEPESPLYHEVHEGSDRGFARIIEFDRGPGFR